MIAKRGKQKLIERNEETLEIEAGKWADALMGAREDLLVASRSAVRKFREGVESGKLTIKRWRELPPLLAALEKAAGECQGESKPPVNVQPVSPLRGPMKPTFLSREEQIERGLLDAETGKPINGHSQGGAIVDV